MIWNSEATNNDNATNVNKTHIPGKYSFSVKANCALIKARIRTAMRPYELNISNWLKVNNYFLAIIFSIWNYICIVCNGVFVGSLHVSTVFHGVYTYFGVY